MLANISLRSTSTKRSIGSEPLVSHSDVGGHLELSSDKDTTGETETWWGSSAGNAARGGHGLLRKEGG